MALAAAMAATEQPQQEVEEAAEYDCQEEDLGAEEDELSGVSGSGFKGPRRPGAAMMGP